MNRFEYVASAEHELDTYDYYYDTEKFVTFAIAESMDRNTVLIDDLLASNIDAESVAHVDEFLEFLKEEAHVRDYLDYLGVES